MMLFFTCPRRCRPQPVTLGSEGLHFGAQTRDEMLDVKRQWRAALHCNVSIEFGGLDDSEELDTRVATMGDGELIDDSDTKAGLDQCAHCGTESRPDGDIVTELLAGKKFG